MDAVLDRIAAWAPRREVFNLYYGQNLHVGTFSSLEYAIACARKLQFDEMYITASFMDEMMTQETVWHCYT